MSDWGWPGVIAHRCGGALAPENALAGLGIAARLGCVAVEFDAMLSADGVPLLIHDETLDRTAGVPGSVAEMPADALLATDVGSVFHPAFRGETIPRLIDALARCRALGLAANLEIKPATGVEIETGRAVGMLLASMAPEERPVLLLSSFSADALRIAAGCVPEIPRAFLVEALDDAVIDTALAFGCQSLNLSRQGLSAAHVAAVKKAGLRCLVYTVNQPDEARRLAAWGVDGVFSDRPDLLLPVSASQNPA